jgi:acetyltransferase-like isoleucine patch superfamily enzyme
VTVEGAVTLGRGLTFKVAPGGRVVLADGAALGDGCRLQVAAGAELRIGRATVLGERCVITAAEAVTVGARCLLADEVVLADADHRFDDVERPVREQGLTTAPVRIGDGVRIGPGAAVVRGVTVGDGAAVGAHSVVTRDVAPGTSVMGVPAGPPPAAPRARGGAGPR